ncbi:MAG: molybdopterin-synthase adenylyltransferase MoeB [Xanthomonadales bacterium]|nr:molybdopterin-synthase adenylyltransferase MoeB [Xanthomonadales bacterium]
MEPRDAWPRILEGDLLVDLREPSEWPAGRPGRSRALPASGLVVEAADLRPPPGRTVLLICASGVRSLHWAQRLQAAGLTALSVRGGVSAWARAGLPIADGHGLDADALERYDRHLRLPGIGAAGQARLLSSRVLLVGAGGLGSPAALYLAAAGVGRLTVVDDDRVERSNLQRQILHSDAAVGTAKVASARQRLLALNPGITVDAIAERLVQGNARELFAGHDLVIDGADNFPTRFLVNATALATGTPWIYGAVQRFQGQVSLFVPGRGPCYRCLFPEPPPAGAAPDCSEAGVFGVLPGAVGVLQATEALKWLLGLGEPLLGRLLVYDALAMRMHELRLDRDPACPGCRSG